MTGGTKGRLQNIMDKKKSEMKIIAKKPKPWSLKKIWHDQYNPRRSRTWASYTEKDTKVRIRIAKNVFTNLKPILKGVFRQTTKKQLVKTLVWSVTGENWTICKTDGKIWKLWNSRFGENLRKWSGPTSWPIKKFWTRLIKAVDWCLIVKEEKPDG